MGIEDFVKITQILGRNSYLATYRSIHTKCLGNARTAYLLNFVIKLISPNVLIELKVVTEK